MPIIQLIETYITLVMIVGALFFVLMVFIIIFGPKVKELLGDWF